MNRLIFAFAMFVLTTLSSGAACSAQDKTKDKAADSSTTSVAATPAVSPMAKPVDDAKKDAKVRYVVYYSADFVVDLKTAQQRFNASGDAVAKAMVELNGSGGMREIANGDLRDLALHLPGGQKEAEHLKPLLEMSWHILIIMNPQGTE